MHEQFDSLARDLARGELSRRRFLGLLGALGGAAGLAALGIRPASAQEEDSHLTNGHTRSELEALRRTGFPPNQSFCARVIVSEPAPCFLSICSVTCPEGFLGAAGCFQPANSNGRPRCGGIVSCDVAAVCETNADCGPREFCARTCCPGTPNRCTPLCPENNP